MENRKEPQSYFAKGSLIATSNGIKPIENVRLGDEVLTHKGRYRKVIATRSSYQSSLIRISGNGVQEIVCTPEQCFLTRTASQNDGKWTRATQMRGQQWLNAAPIEMIDCEMTAPSFVQNANLAYILGCWFVSGSVQKKQTESGECLYMENIPSTSLEDFLAHLIASDLEHEIISETIDGYEKTDVVIEDTVLCCETKTYFFKSDNCKGVPSILQEADSLIKLAFLKGAMSQMEEYDNILAEESIYPDKILPATPNAYIIAAELKLLCSSIGLNVSIYPKGDNAPVLSFLPIRPADVSDTISGRSGWWGDVFDMKGMPSNMFTPSYALSVDEDHSYTVSGISVLGA